MTWRDHIKVHPAADLFPLMSDAELKELADDIKENGGLTHPIMRDADGLILDGRNRLKACEVAGVEPRFDVYEGTNPIGFVISTNLKRRHLNESQRAMIGAKLATLKHGANQAPSGKFAARPDVPTQAVAAVLVGISERSLRNAAVVRDHGTPELIKAVEQGTISVSAAAKRAKPQPKPKPQPKSRPKPSRVDGRLIAPIKLAFQNIEVSVADVAKFRSALQRLARAVADALEATK